MTVVTRFAPSPTGDLHIGGARTALFNLLYARHMDGKYLVRIEDTDKARNTQEAMDGIVNALDWLGLQGDEPIVYQSNNAARHVQVANTLLARGAAYYDYTTPDEMAALKQVHLDSGAKGPFRYKSPWRDAELRNPTSHGVVRLKAPCKGNITIQDLVQGEVTVRCSELDDLILLRSDGTPTYMLAVVVDDYDMGVTHVIRGDDHLNNAFRQIPIYDGMGWARPTYAHVPLIFSEGGKKLSKRTGAAGVFEYKDMGILPEAMLNYLARLGWGHGDDELFPMDQAARWFDVKDVNRAPARIDMKKLKNISAHYMKTAGIDQLFTDLWGRVCRNGEAVYGITPAQICMVIESLRTRVTNLNELHDNAKFLWRVTPFEFDEKAQAALDLTIIQQVIPLLEVEWSAEDLEATVHQYVESSGLTLKQVASSLRVALTGRTVSPPIYDVMLALGKRETLARLGRLT